ncbi:helix-turn-helix domain-containing protein [Haliscomenobacter sp.]|uniref:helix-turn-helix domain-containing protein n=1 Tax=Haliscomenobacter sp. TaxID=2717303 RepID=UPI00359333DC
MSLPENIRKVRLILGLKQDAVAKALGIRQSTYTKFETGMIKVGEDKLAEIANALGVSEEVIKDLDKHLVFIHNIETQNGGNLQEQVNYYASMNEMERTHYEARIDQLEDENKFLKKLIEERLS